MRINLYSKLSPRTEILVDQVEIPNFSVVSQVILYGNGIFIFQEDRKYLEATSFYRVTPKDKPSPLKLIL